MIHLYSWSTPNGRKIPIMLEEIGEPYELHPIDISRNDQFAADFLKIAPNNKIPAITDDRIVDTTGDGAPLAIFESGAILTYLAETSGRLLAPSGPARFKVFEWLHWQIGGLGPMLGQLGFFAVRAEEKAPLAIERFTQEAGRLLGVMERRLSEAPYLAGGEYSIADIACYPWLVAATTILKQPLTRSLRDKPALHRWLDVVGARPAVVKGMQVPPG